jgi:hypothetical protein
MMRDGMSLALAIAALGAFAVGCGDDDRSGGRDTGPIPIDSGPPRDTGPAIDSGPGRDAGPPTGMCPSGMCDYVAQTGCMAGEGCYIGMAGPQCAPSGMGGDGSACMNINDCQSGFTCVVEAMGMPGECHKMCCAIGSVRDCPMGQSCSTRFVDDMGTFLGVGFCSSPDSCDVLMQTGCAMGEACYVTDLDDGSVRCLTPTATAGAEGAMCEGDQDCQAGNTCLSLDMGMTFTCLKYCNAMMGATSGCAEGQMCNRLSMGVPNIGVCITP